MHYICTGGCNGVSDQPGTCQAAECKDHEKDLKSCKCEDGQHAEVKAQAESSESAE